MVKDLSFCLVVPLCPFGVLKSHYNNYIVGIPVSYPLSLTFFILEQCPFQKPILAFVSGPAMLYVLMLVSLQDIVGACI